MSYVIRRSVLIVCILLACLIIQSCKTCHCANSSIQDRSDSVRIVEKTYTEIIHDTTYLEVPVEIQSVVVNDSVSTLETEFAISKAEITKEGFLKHSLENKPMSIPVEYDSKVEHKITEKNETSSDVQTITEIEYIEREYSWWDKTRFYVLYVIVMVLLIKYWKQIVKIARKLILKI